MSKNYNHLSLEQRYQIEALNKAGQTQKSIALQLGIHPSTVSRELRRNTPQRGAWAGRYRAGKAHQKACLRHQSKAKRCVFDSPMKDFVSSLLRVERWSPELISQKGKESGQCPISHEWIYQWIWKCKHGNRREDRGYKKLYEYLRHGRRRRKRGNRKDSRGIIPNRVSIEKRPLVVNKRKRVGDIEVDLMMGKNHKGALLVMTDRATLHTRLKKVASKNSDQMARTIVRQLGRNAYKVRTITFDNDKAFSAHQWIAGKLQGKAYFTRPYTSQDKGTVENRIGVIRRFLPKKTDLRLVTDKEIRSIENKINNRPVRKFNYLTANQVLQRKLHL